MSESLRSELEQAHARRHALERQLAWGILGASAYLVLVGAGSIVAALLLLDHTRSTDLAVGWRRWP